MGKKQKAQLSRLYRRYHRTGGKASILGFLRSFMPEIIFRTTKLEGEHATRSSIKNLF